MNKMFFYQINYIVALPEEELTETSLFQGFSEGLLKRNNIFRYVNTFLPPTVLELYCPSVRTLQLRIAGITTFHVFPLMATELQKISISPQMPFWVVFTDSETSDLVMGWSNRLTISPLIINSDADIELLSSSDKVRDKLFLHCDSVINHIKNNDSNYPEEIDAMLKRSDASDHKINAGINVFNHNTTVPNELTLLSAGFHCEKVEKPLVGEDKIYIDAIVKSVDKVNKLRQAIPETNLYRLSPPSLSLILTSPGFYPHIREIRRSKHEEQHEFQNALRILQTQKTYSTIIADAASISDIENNIPLKMLFSIRSMELTAYTNAISLRASSNICPVIRISPAVDQVKHDIIRLSDSLRSGKSNLRKTRKLTTQLFQGLQSSVNEAFMKRIDQPQTHIKIISDSPLELLPIRGIPLMLRYSTSRIPTTPGSLSFGNILPHDQIALTMNDFREVLVIRSFQDDDPLRSDLENAIGVFKLENGNDLPVRIVDVKNKDQFMNALSNFKGALVLFDGHGSHKEDIGKIHLADEAIDVWSLRLKVRFPPIFFICACDTHSIDRSHATAGNGLLYCGCRSVIASLLPIESKFAAQYSARLLFRICTLLPLITSSDWVGTIRWDWVVSRLMRMLYASELLFSIAISKKLTSSKIDKTLVRTTMIIHTYDEDWYEQFMEAASDEFGLSVDELSSAMQENLPFAETFKYIHLGNPETIVIRSDEPEKINISDD